MPLDGPPELTSSQFWDGPGAGTFFTSAATLEALAALLGSILGGHQSAAAGQASAWNGPAGLASLAAEIPYFAWLVEAMAQISAAGAQIAATGEAFEAFKAGTPTPGEVAENQSEHVFLNQANIPALGMLTPAIIANRIEYMRKWITGTTNTYGYAAASASGVQSIPPLPPPMPTAAPVSGDVSGAAQLAADKPLQKAMQGAEAPMGQLMPLLSQLSSAPSQLGQLAGGGGCSRGSPSCPSRRWARSCRCWVSSATPVASMSSVRATRRRARGSTAPRRPAARSALRCPAAAVGVAGSVAARRWHRCAARVRGPRR